MAENKRMEEKKEVTQKVENAQNNYVDERVKKITQEAVEAINLVTSVIEALDNKDKNKAIETIEKALGKLEVLVARDPNLQVVPVDVKEQVIDFPGTVDDVEAAKTEIVALIKAGEVQLARDIMLNLASELDIYVTALPIGTYPVVLKAIIPLIEQEKFEEAKKLIIEALETLVIEKIVIPLPILRAEQAIIRANELANKENPNKDELKELLAYAKEQLQLAEALGYGKVEIDYKDLYEEIEKLEKILASDESTEDIFKTLKEKLSSIMVKFNKPKAPTNMPKAEDKKEESK
ncbi:YfdX family protein [Caminibacter mediatlanticus TB-2]|uniref:YfdX family protein n=1 Tax=Caminibacter mediatlanticus TB-2 TaxID=391592 RepID=A0ABX5V7N8_9BACT|nr:YfdX family protein [Caminibacter mediatlanticus]QCT94246.1 YfdX family protein [Caminibacter mediatlanticus TB-2]